MLLYSSSIFMCLGVLSCFPTLLTWKLWNLWLSDLGHTSAFIASLSVIGIPNYFKSFFIPYLEHTTPRKLHKNHWINWMIYSCMLLGCFSHVLGTYFAKLHFLGLALLGMIVISAGIVFEKASYCFQLSSLQNETRKEALWSYKMGHRVGGSLGEVIGLFLAHYYGWPLVYSFFSFLFLITASCLFFAPASSERDDSRIPLAVSSWSYYYDLALQHKVFLIACMLTHAGDSLAGWFLTLYLRGLGLSYLEIAVIGKFWGLGCFFIGAFMGRWIWKKQSHMLIFWSMAACFAHGISLIPLSYLDLLRDYLPFVFLFKNITLGFKSVLLAAVVSDYLSSVKSTIGLAFLSSIARSIVILLISFSGPLLSDPRLLFWLAAGFALPGMASLYWLQREWPASSEDSVPTPLAIV